MTDPTLWSLDRKLAVVENELANQGRDLAEVKDTLKRAMQLIAGEFLALVVGLILLIVGRV